MPASSPVLALRPPVSVLMRVDLPTLGMPQISTRIGLAMPPRLGDSSKHDAMMARAGAVMLASSEMARVLGWAL
ncbi:hypothetical protein D9M69_675240 [compost metagenome]